MMHYRLATAVLVLLAASHQACGAPMHVLVKGAQDGQGLLLRRADTCYLLTAGHVMEDADAATAVASGVKQRLAEARLVERFPAPLDLALLRVVGELAQDCGDEIDVYRADLGKWLNHRASASLPFVFGSGQGGSDGGLRRLPLELVDVGPEFLRVAATRAGDRLMQGISGGLMLVDGRPAGVITTVSGGLGVVLRLDRAMEALVRFFERPPPRPNEGPAPVPAPANEAAERGNLASLRAGAVVAAWSALPSAAAHLPSNLLDAGAVRSWNASTARWPVDIDIRLGAGQAVTFSRLEFVQASDQDTGRAARDVEVFTSVDGESWRSVHQGTLFVDEPVKSVPMAPVRATHLRLRIHSNWGAPDWVSLRQLRVYAE